MEIIGPYVLTMKCSFLNVVHEFVLGEVSSLIKNTLFYSFYLFCVCMYVCLWGCTDECTHSQRPEAEFPRTGVIDGHELSQVSEVCYLREQYMLFSTEPLLWAQHLDLPELIQRS